MSSCCFFFTELVFPLSHYRTSRNIFHPNTYLCVPLSLYLNSYFCLYCCLFTRKEFIFFCSVCLSLSLCDFLFLFRPSSPNSASHPWMLSVSPHNDIHLSPKTHLKSSMSFGCVWCVEGKYWGVICPLKVMTLTHSNKLSSCTRNAMAVMIKMYIQ